MSNICHSPLGRLIEWWYNMSPLICIPVEFYFLSNQPAMSWWQVLNVEPIGRGRAGGHTGQQPRGRSHWRNDSSAQRWARSPHLLVHAVQVLLAEHVERHGVRHAGPTLPSGRAGLLVVGHRRRRLTSPETHANRQTVHTGHKPF